MSGVTVTLKASAKFLSGLLLELCADSLQVWGQPQLFL